MSIKRSLSSRPGYFKNKKQNKSKTRLILFSNSEPPRLRDVVSHLITTAAAPKGIYSDPL